MSQRGFLTPGFLTWCHARKPWTLDKLASQTAVQRQGTRAKVLLMAADGVADERIAVDVAAPSARRDGIAGWRWRYPGSSCALAMT